MKRYPKLGLMLFALLTISSLTGCSATQVRDRAYLQAVELDNPNEPTLLLHDFEEAGVAADGTGKSFESALKDAAIPVGKELFLGHLELIAYQDPAFGKTLNTMLETYRISPACKVLGLPKGTTLEETDTTQLVEQLRCAETNGILPKTDLFTILREFSGKSGTSLLPIVTPNAFSAVIVTKDSCLCTLSPSAIAGLCWLRGDNHPSQITLPDGTDFTVSSSATRLEAEETDGHAVVTISIHLCGTGDFDAVANLVKTQCLTALDETIYAHHADVFDLEACLRSQCDAYATKTNWETILEQVEFQVKVVSKL